MTTRTTMLTEMSANLMKQLLHLIALPSLERLVRSRRSLFFGGIFILARWRRILEGDSMWRGVLAFVVYCWVFALVLLFILHGAFDLFRLWSLLAGFVIALFGRNSADGIRVALVFGLR